MLEVVIILLVLGALAILILSSLQTVQAKSRDTVRRSEIDNIAKQLETCYADKATCAGAYPSLLQLTDTSAGGFIDHNLPGFDKGWLLDSSAGTIQANAASAATQYTYTTYPSECTGIASSNPCQGFTLQAYQETNSEHPYIKESLNK